MLCCFLSRAILFQHLHLQQKNTEIINTSWDLIVFAIINESKKLKQFIKFMFTVGENKNQDLEHNGISVDQQDRQVIQTIQLFSLRLTLTRSAGCTQASLNMSYKKCCTTKSLMPWKLCMTKSLTAQCWFPMLPADILHGLYRTYCSLGKVFNLLMYFCSS